MDAERTLTETVIGAEVVNDFAVHDFVPFPAILRPKSRGPSSMRNPVREIWE
jgi:hypothetical protein